MTPLEKIYWIRLALGIVAAFICAGYGIATRDIVPNNFVFNTFMNSLSIAFIVYLISYYILKSKFVLIVEKPQKIARTGIGVYFISWLVFWVLLYTIIAGPLPPAT